MRIGLIADIHGNLIALDTVFAELDRDRDQVDRIICLGDLAALGPQPTEVIVRLRERDIPSVMGNTDAWLIPDPPVRAAAPTSAPTRDLTRWCANRLSQQEIAYLQDLSITNELPLDGHLALLCFHGSPRSVDDVIAATTPSAELEAMDVRQQAAVFACGHTHVQLMRRHHETRVINPGSVGLPGVGPGGPDLPVNQDVRWAEYAVIDASIDRLSIDLRRVPLDVEGMIAVARASGMPQLEWWAGRWSRG